MRVAGLALLVLLAGCQISATGLPAITAGSGAEPEPASSTSARPTPTVDESEVAYKKGEAERKKKEKAAAEKQEKEDAESVAAYEAEQQKKKADAAAKKAAKKQALAAECAKTFEVRRSVFVAAQKAMKPACDTENSTRTWIETNCETKDTRAWQKVGDKLVPVGDQYTKVCPTKGRPAGMGDPTKWWAKHSMGEDCTVERYMSDEDEQTWRDGYKAGCFKVDPEPLYGPPIDGLPD